jgi:hypothetical protein
MWKHYLTIKGARGQASISQARFVPNEFKVEFQGTGTGLGTLIQPPILSRHRRLVWHVMTNWKAYSRAYVMAHGKTGLLRFPDRRFADLGF